MRLTARTYEGSTLVLEHTFHGRTVSEVIAIVDAHRKTDAFLRAASTHDVGGPGRGHVSTGLWHGIKLTTRWRWGR
jgi:hypothetical protein